MHYLVNLYFPNHQCMVLQNHARVKHPFKRERQVKIYWSTKCRLEREYPRNKQQYKCPRTRKFLVNSSTLIEGTKIRREGHGELRQEVNRGQMMILQIMVGRDLKFCSE